MAVSLSLQKNRLVVRVKEIIVQSMEYGDNPALDLRNLAGAGPGKLLRTNLAAFILGDDPTSWPPGVEYVCAAVEIMHTASLFHDDVIDGAAMRRGNPALWKSFSMNGAVLLGDDMFCKAVMLLTESEGGIHLGPFMKKAHEVCRAETEQELVLRGGSVDTATCCRIARSKTGPFFAMTALACGYGGDEALIRALEDAGYAVGTAYQLADDLLDELGDDSTAGKTLGTDRLRKKFTVAHADGRATEVIADIIKTLCDRALRTLEPWPLKREGVRAYIREVLAPSFKDVLQRECVDFSF